MDELAGCLRRQRATQSKFGLIASLNRPGVEVKEVTLLNLKVGPKNWGLRRGSGYAGDRLPQQRVAQAVRAHASAFGDRLRRGPECANADEVIK
jgi:hypothetical protein